MPVARLRGCKSLSNADQFKAALAFTFVSDTELATSPNLLPPLSLASVILSPTHSPPRSKRGSNYQHILLFNPEDGVLSLCRLTLEKHLARETGIGNVAASVAMGVSVSLPGMGAMGRLSSSPSSKLVHTGKVEQSTEIGAKVDVVATYNLKRGKDWKEVLKPMGTSLVKQTNSISGEYVILPFKPFSQVILIVAGLLRRNFRHPPVLNGSFPDQSISLINFRSTLWEKIITL
jgi:hypothetical protein